VRTHPPLAVSPRQEGRTQCVDAHRTSSQPHQEAFDVAREGTAGEWLAIGILKVAKVCSHDLTGTKLQHYAVFTHV